MQGVTACATCRGNSFSSNPGSNACQQCVWPMVVNADRSKCETVDCPLGEEPNQRAGSSVGESRCSPCSTGMFRGSNVSNVCSTCSGNSQASMMGMTVGGCISFFFLAFINVIKSRFFFFRFQTISGVSRLHQHPGADLFARACGDTTWILGKAQQKRLFKDLSVCAKQVPRHHVAEHPHRQLHDTPVRWLAVQHGEQLHVRPVRWRRRPGYSRGLRAV